MNQIDPAFFKPFIEGALNTLKVQCKTDASHDHPYFKGAKLQPPFAIAGMIEIASSTFTGSITLYFSESVFLGIMTRMLDEPFTEITDDLQDGVAELLNIIYGSAKITLNQNGHQIQKAIPTVVRGEKLQEAIESKLKTLVLPFKTDLGEFHIEICLAN
jgi:chemotaxis protein CheX